MKRKEFLKRTVQMGMAAGSLVLLPNAASPRPSGKGQKPEKDAQEEFKKKFKDAWVATLMENIENKLEPKEQVELMEACGRACARRGPLFKLADSCRGDVGQLVDRLAGFLGKEGCALEGNVVHLSYPKCFCELVADGPERLPQAYCHCSEGWIKEMFETAAQKKVRVQTLQTVKRGASSCKFLITI